MDKMFLRASVLVSMLICLLHPVVIKAQELLVEQTEGPITKKELLAFKNFIKDYNPNEGQLGSNIWVFGAPGKAIEACGLMYEATKDTAILNQMVFYCDRALATRNDLAPANIGGQLKTWTGNIDPIWPSNKTAQPQAGAGIEQGSVLAHLAFCSRLILENQPIWNKKVSIGDPHNFGTTYKERALKYIKEGDYVMDNWIIKRFVRTDDHNRLYFPGAPNTYKPNGPAPWNQLFMVTNGLIRLTECHLILKDDPERVKRYDEIVQPNLDWFLSSLTPDTSAVNTPVYQFDYALGSRSEDANHFAYDVEGLWIAYNSGRYGVKFNDLVPFANTYVDVILGSKQDNGRYIGMLNGESRTGNMAGYNYIRDEYFYLADFRPDKFETMVGINRQANKIADFLPATARILWQKNRRYQTSLKQDTAAKKSSLIKTFIYKTIDTLNLKLTCYYPEGYVPTKKYPAILFFFGGGWVGGSTAQLEPQAKYFATRGMIAILADYRVSSRNKTTPFEAAKDARTAMRYIRSHSEELLIDTTKIVASGASAGGHLAAACDLLAIDEDNSISTKPAALVLFNPVIDNGPGGYGYERIGNRYMEISPLHNIKAGAAPTILFYGDQDKHVPLKTAKLYQTELRKVGTECKLFFYPGQGHGFFNYHKQGDNEYFNKTVKEADDFLTSLKIINEKR
ncbi:MAG TPA: alpha/beta hydrolase fold domain-containing protein [Pelobium sp.]|nr:alpha/beta hydrolase fold domain-containing protein [Pelobium sp.]